MSNEQIRLMNERDLDQILEWRNHPNISQYMYSTHNITPQEHKSWFENVKRDKKKSLLIYEQNYKAMGFVSIARSRSEDVADWGFYVAPDALPGTGRKLGIQALRYSFTELCLHKICGQALDYNKRSINFHRSLNFSEEGRLREHHYNGNKFHDVIYFGLLKREWLNTIKE